MKKPRFFEELDAYNDPSEMAIDADELQVGDIVHDWYGSNVNNSEIRSIITVTAETVVVTTNIGRRTYHPRGRLQISRPSKVK